MFRMVLIPNIIKKVVPLKGTFDIFFNVNLFYVACHKTLTGLRCHDVMYSTMTYPDI